MRMPLPACLSRDRRPPLLYTKKNQQKPPTHNPKSFWCPNVIIVCHATTGNHTTYLFWKTRMESLGEVSCTRYETDSRESQTKTVYLYNCRLTLEDGSILQIPDARLEHCTSTVKKSKKTTKSYVLCQVTLWTPSSLPPLKEFVITAINDTQFRLYATTDDRGRMTARSDPPPTVEPTPPTQTESAAAPTVESTSCFCSIQ